MKQGGTQCIHFSFLKVANRYPQGEADQKSLTLEIYISCQQTSGHFCRFSIKLIYYILGAQINAVRLQKIALAVMKVS